MSEEVEKRKHQMEENYNNDIDDIIESTAVKTVQKLKNKKSAILASDNKLNGTFTDSQTNITTNESNENNNNNKQMQQQQQNQELIRDVDDSTQDQENIGVLQSGSSKQKKRSIKVKRPLSSNKVNNNNNNINSQSTVAGVPPKLQQLKSMPLSKQPNPGSKTSIRPSKVFSLSGSKSISKNNNNNNNSNNNVESSDFDIGSNRNSNENNQHDASSQSFAKNAANANNVNNTNNNGKSSRLSSGALNRSNNNQGFNQYQQQNQSPLIKGDDLFKKQNSNFQQNDGQGEGGGETIDIYQEQISPMNKNSLKNRSVNNGRQSHLMSKKPGKLSQKIELQQQKQQAILQQQQEQAMLQSYNINIDMAIEFFIQKGRKLKEKIDTEQINPDFLNKKVLNNKVFHIKYNHLLQQMCQQNLINAEFRNMQKKPFDKIEKFFIEKIDEAVQMHSLNQNIKRKTQVVKELLKTKKNQTIAQIKEEQNRQWDWDSL